ncbi:MAG TPA: hypothetical protein VGC42_28105, partial [Kofleriaceae bacterium]
MYRHEARRITCYALAASAALALVLPLIGAALGAVFAASRAPALAVLGIAGLSFVLLVTGAVLLGVVVPRRRWAGDAALARWVG